MSGLMAKWKDHRAAVRELLKKRKKGERSAYWLSKQLPGGITAQHLYGYLRGENGVSIEIQAKINEILGIKFTDE